MKGLMSLLAMLASMVGAAAHSGSLPIGQAPQGQASVTISTPAGTTTQTSTLTQIAPGVFGATVSSSLPGTGISVSAGSTSTVIVPQIPIQFPNIPGL